MKNNEYREIALNGSGYHDPTAYRAIRRTLKEDKIMTNFADALAGDIWTVQKATGNVCEALILAKHQSYATILLLTNKEPSENVVMVHSRSIMYADTGKVSYVFSDNMVEFIKTVPDSEYDGIMRSVAQSLGLDEYCPRIYDEKEEHAVIKAITMQDNELDLQVRYAALERERDIYKELFYKAFPQIGEMTK